MRFGVDKIPSDLLIDIASNHRTLRKQMGYSQSELARRSGVSLGSLKRFELSGQISLESLLKLAHLLGHLNDFEKLLNPIPNLSEIEKLFSDKTRA
ncbi:MAG: helix-turn-helix transcriptional regulator [bacterium]|nr:helix-turn-helix transcriptional regulator [bacterium]